ncbi:insulin-cleaving metalloproteinase outer membrane protein [Chitinimonas prasina]|uniref:Insulin-cleaving metalloproteinase outer membrane protein n=1 Tax=Chitinimonas prasina TaxID=1434937 RepID=A0ABQ5YAJ7_9NEIS|nr:imelysin family protein [Chitinimonas prasina]GLR11437.1 insulin-cleaving metalloproteinase outer membrane protein [Chitinimonas prasina]
MSLFRPCLIAAALATSLFAQAAEPVTSATVANHYATLVHAGYEDSLAGAKQLQASIDAFLAAPSEEGLNKARQSWLAAREWYGQTEAFRFYGGPIDGDNGPEGQINAWPMDEAYVDYVKGKPKAGVVNNLKAKLSREALIGLNEKGGEENISTGWHAIEFLLWGQDLSKDGPGARPFTDFVDGKAPNADRRRAYLKIVSDLLVDDLASVSREWAPNAANFRAKFVADPTAVQKMLTGIGTLSHGELAGERMEVALASKAQEDEHSCFADNTHRDVVTNAQGIQNVWEGSYKRADGTVLAGPSLRALVAAKDAKLADKTSADIAASVKLAGEIKAPFDQEIVGKNTAPGRQRVRAVIDALRKQAKGIVSAAKSLGIKNLNTNV